jgi:hypothetical protein
MTTGRFLPSPPSTSRGMIIAAIIAVTGVGLPQLALADEACAKVITGTGRTCHVEGCADFAKYRVKVPPKLAEQRAIANWQANVVKKCPQASTRWYRARGKSVDCDGSTGHFNCTVSAKPGRRYFGL